MFLKAPNTRDPRGSGILCSITMLHVLLKIFWSWLVKNISFNMWISQKIVRVEWFSATEAQDQSSVHWA